MEELMAGIIIGLLAGCLAGMIIGSAIINSIFVVPLGNAICKEAGKGQFISFEDNIVTCKDNSKLKKYDEIQIRVE